ncbi:MAG: transposase [Bryobacterales bacterium]|nr:transposase [Bryobacterales bacterium]
MSLRHTVGIDVSKARLDAHRLADGEAAEFDNTKAGFRQLIAWSGEGVECIAYEASGPYHRDPEQALHRDPEQALLEQGLSAARVNPCQARRFAQASGCRAKTDQVDAAMMPVQRQAKYHLRQIERQIQAIDRELAGLLGSDPDLERKARILESIPGVSSVTAAGLLATLLEMADLQPRALSSLAGVWRPSRASPAPGRAAASSRADTGKLLS